MSHFEKQSTSNQGAFFPLLVLEASAIFSLKDPVGLQEKDREHADDLRVRNRDCMD